MDAVDATIEFLTRPGVVGLVSGFLLSTGGAIVSHFFNARQFRNTERMALYKQLNNLAVHNLVATENMTELYASLTKKIKYEGPSDEELLAQVELLASRLVRHRWKRMVSAVANIRWEAQENPPPGGAFDTTDPDVVAVNKAIKGLLWATRNDWRWGGF